MLVDRHGHCLHCRSDKCNGCTKSEENPTRPITAGGDIALNALKDWRAGLWSANTTQKDRNIVVARNQAMMRDDALYAGATRQERSIVVGPNVRIKIRPDYRKLRSDGLNVDREWAQEFALEARRQWICDMEDSTRKWVDASQKQTFSHFLGLAWMEWIGSGEILVLSVPEDGPSERPMLNSWAMIDPARLSTPTNLLHRQDITYGVRESKTAAPIAYFIADYHPDLSDPSCANSVAFRSLIKRKHGGKGPEERWRRYTPRFSTGRPQVIHFFDKDRANLTRQKPAFAAALKEHFSASTYSEAALDAAVRDARMAMWIESSDPHLWQAFATGQDDIAGCINELYGSYHEAKAELHENSPLTINDTVIPQLPMNEAIRTNALGSPSDNHPDFLKSMLMYGARALELSQQTFRGDASDANFSALRHATVMDWYSRMYKRDLLFNYVGKPIYMSWFEDKVLMGDLDMPVSGTRLRKYNWFLKNRSVFSDITFYGPGQVGIDDQKQYNTIRMKLQDGSMTREQYYFEYTNDYLEDAADQLEYEAGLNLPPIITTRSERTGTETGDIG